MLLAAVAKVNAILENKELPIGLYMPDSVLCRELYRCLDAIVFIPSHIKSKLSIPKSYHEQFVSQQPLLGLLVNNIQSKFVQEAILSSIVEIINEVDVSNRRINATLHQIKDESIYQSYVDGVIFLNSRLYDLFPEHKNKILLRYLIDKQWNMSVNSTRRKVYVYQPLPLDPSLFDAKLLTTLITNLHAIPFDPLSTPFHMYQKSYYDMATNAKCIVNTSYHTADLYPLLLAVCVNIPIVSVKNEFLYNIFEDTIIWISDDDYTALHKLTTKDFNTYANKQKEIVKSFYLNPFNAIKDEWIETIANLSSNYIEV